MANVDAPHGFDPLKSLGGGDMITRIYTKASGDGVILGIGDLVTLTGALDTIEQYDQDDLVLGSCGSFGAASTETSHPVTLAFEDTLFEAQEDGVGGAMGTAAEGSGVDVIVNGVASATSPNSIMEIDSNTASNAALDLHLYQAAPYIDNDATLTNARWFVLMNDRQYANATAGV